MSSWSSSQSQLIGGKIEHFCGVYDFLNDDLPSEYYKDLLYVMYQKHKRLKKNVEYEQWIDVLAIDKSMFLSHLVLMSAPLGLDLVSAMILDLKSELGHLVHQTI
ncbi:hypothetical protein Tco_0415292 [Tanacetum coccineum]